MNKLKKLTYSESFRPIAVFILSAVFLLAMSCVQVISFADMLRLYGAESLPANLTELARAQLINDTVHYQIRFTFRGFFDFVFHTRFIAIFLLILFSAAFLSVLCLFLSRAGKKPGSDDIRLDRLDSFPPDLALILWAVLAVLITRGIGARAASLERDMIHLPVVLLKQAASSLVLMLSSLWLLHTLAARIRAGRPFANTAAVFLWRCLTRAFDRLMDRLSQLVYAAQVDANTAVISMIFAAVQLTGALMAALGPRDLGIILLALSDAVFLGFVVLGAAQLRALISAGEKLAAGKLDTRVDVSGMYPHLRRHGEDLGSLAEGLGRAVDQRLRSERMRTELITNVSHDIKTPLTSIINYVDLLKLPHTPEEGAQYLDVLVRQSDKLRRLITDLVEVSRASTGSIQVELVPTDLTELLNQAVAEYSERLDASGLTPIVALPRTPVSVLVDGRQLWRVLDNLLGNAVKYAQPGTRLYIDASVSESLAVVTMKNISRERLNISGDELMERFVRGDASRSTEGSGLGLSISGSLMELMGGELRIDVDGDLFKATVELKLA